MPTYIVGLNAGLGNSLFQVAFSEYVQNTIGKETNICLWSSSAYADTNLFDSVLLPWKHRLRPYNTTYVVKEEYLHPITYNIDYLNRVCSEHDSVYLDGFFQNYNYITSTFLNKLSLPSDALSRHAGICNTVFIHIRGGDYIGSCEFDVGLDEYYSRAIEQFPEDTKFSVFTNDIPYMKTKKFLDTISYEVIEENEIDSLFLMSKCSGGICANSSFSWWGAFLDRNRKLILPSKWLNDSKFNTKGFYFPEAIVL